MAYLVLARKYRPQRFEDTVGQEAIVQTLTNAVKTGKVSHAYLFCGPRGVGKTSTARILSKALNCPQPDGFEPCASCEVCQDVARGEDLDVIEIDGASNRKVEEIEKIRENVKFRPARCRYKIYIVDEVHMLSLAAFNALLKTLEEPPEHVKFIFATTEPHKVPDTIQSRCQIMPFGKIRPEHIRARLEKICALEGFSVEPAALARIAQQSLGGMRDALSLLDRLVASGADTVSEEGVSLALGTVGKRHLVGMLSAVVARDERALLEQLAAFDERGGDYEELLADLLRAGRAALHLKLLGPRAGALDAMGLVAEDLAPLAEVSSDGWLYLLENLDEAGAKLKDALDERVSVELLLLRLARVGDLAAVPAWVERLGQLEELLEAKGLRALEAGPAVPRQDAPPLSAAPAPAPPRVAPAPRAEAPAPVQRAPAMPGPASRTPGAPAPQTPEAPAPQATRTQAPGAPAPQAAAQGAVRQVPAPHAAAAQASAPQRPASAPQALPVRTPQPPPAPPGDPAPVAPAPDSAPQTFRRVNVEVIRRDWPQLVDSLRQTGRTLAPFFARATPARWENGVLTLEVAPLSGFERERLGSQEVRASVGQHLQRTFGVPMRWTLHELAERAPTRSNPVEELRENPLVKKVLDTFSGQIIPPRRRGRR